MRRQSAPLPLAVITDAAAGWELFVAAAFHTVILPPMERWDNKKPRLLRRGQYLFVLLVRQAVDMVRIELTITQCKSVSIPFTYMPINRIIQQIASAMDEPLAEAGRAALISGQPFHAQL